MTTPSHTGDSRSILASLSIEQLDPAALDRVRPLWLLLHAHHQAVAPELAPYVSDAESWPVRRTYYAGLLEEGGQAFVARAGREDVAYMMCAREPSPWPATFAGVDEVAELATLVVRPELRGDGVGSTMLDAFDAWLAEIGVPDAVIGVVPANTGATALYRRRGFEPTWLTLTRFGRAPGQPEVEASVTVEPVAARDIAGLEPLWLALHRHHQAVAPELAPFVADGPSWEIVRGLLAAAVDDGLLLRAGPACAPLGFACVGVTHDDPLWADTWRTGADVADIKLLVVAPEARGLGIGTALLEAIDARLEALGVHDQAVGAIAPNGDAIRLYERRGFRPAWLQLTRFAAREA